MRPPGLRCVLVPATAPVWMAEAVVAGGATLSDASDAEAAICFHGGTSELSSLLVARPDIGWVQLSAAGVDDYADIIDDARIWTCAKGAFATPVAEHALALTLAGLRQVGRYARHRQWTEPRGRNLVGARVLIIGGGGIASALVGLLAPFRATIEVMRRHPTAMTGVAAVHGPEALRELLPRADVVVLPLALTAETRGLIGAEELALMAEHAWLVNVGRGPLIETEALVQALRLREIGGAALDVTDPEPLPSSHPLWTEERCIITPHVGNTPEMHRSILTRFIIENIERRAAGLPLRGVVDPRLGY